MIKVKHWHLPPSLEACLVSLPSGSESQRLILALEEHLQSRFCSGGGPEAFWGITTNSECPLVLRTIKWNCPAVIPHDTYKHRFVLKIIAWLLVLEG